MSAASSLPTLVVVSGPLGSGKTTLARAVRRGHDDPLRRAHADPGPDDAAEQRRRHHAFNRVSVAAPSLEVDTTDGYRPGLSEIVAFVNGPG